ncbi:MAG: hypothetical protein ACK5O2_13535 [Microthrixaceae bacterium]
MALVVVAGWVGRRLWFFSDDWNIYAEYYRGNLLEPFNGHLSLLPAGIYQLLFNTVGVGSYLPYRVVGLVALVVLGFQLVRFAGSRVSTVVAVLAVAAVMWNSFGTTNVMFPFLMNFSLPIAALLAVWWHLDRIESSAVGDGRQDHRSRSGDGAAAVSDAQSTTRAGGPGRSAADSEPPTGNLVAIGLWLAVALAASGLGVVAALAVGVELLVRRSRARVWVAWSVSTVLWLGWWLSHREANEISTDVGQVVPYLLRMLWAGPTSIAAGNPWLGLLIASLLLAAIARVVINSRRVDPRVLGALAAAFAFAALTSLTRQGTFPPIPPDELRYGWTIGAYVVCAAVALAPALVRSMPRELPGWWAPVRLCGVVLATLVLVVGAYRLIDEMGDWSDQVAEAAPGLRTNLYAAEAVGADRMGPEEVIGPLSFVPVHATDYLDAVATVGSPLAGAAAGGIGGRADQREAASSLLFDNIGLVAPEPVVGDVPADLTGCTTEEIVAPGGFLDIVELAGDADALEVSRFGAPPRSLDVPTGLSRLQMPEDAPVATSAAEPYRVSVPASTSRICGPQG